MNVATFVLGSAGDDDDDDDDSLRVTTEIVMTTLSACKQMGLACLSARREESVEDDVVNYENQLMRRKAA